MGFITCVMVLKGRCLGLVADGRWLGRLRIFLAGSDFYGDR